MEVAASSIAFLQAAGICVKLAKSLIHKYGAYKNADEKIADLIVRVEGIWIKIEAQIEFLQSVIETIDERLLNYQQACLERLQKRLSLAILDLESLIDTDFNSVSLKSLSLNIKARKKLQYATFEKSLRKSVDDLELWRKDFDPSWFLVGRIANATIDRALDKQSGASAAQDQVNTISAIREAIGAAKTGKVSQSSIFRDSQFLSTSQVNLLNSNIKLSKLSIDDTPVLLDTTAFDVDLDKVRYTPHVQDLARLLSLSKPQTLGLLECLGVIKLLKPNGSLSQFQFVYKVSQTLSKPSTLRMSLSGPPSSLDARFRLARSLARSVMAIHSADFVHKNIRPEMIVVFEDSSDPLPVSFLVGFERFRPLGAGTNLTGDMVWERNIYRFPNRQGIKPEEAYIMQHDIYSLGVCLLEIGIWTPFATTTVPPQPGPQLNISKQLAMKENLQAAWEIKKIFQEMAKNLLPSAMGIVYTEVVISCLTCLDQGATNLFVDPKEVYDEDGILVGVAFIEKILMRLESIRL